VSDAHLRAVDRHLSEAAPPRWRATPNPPLQQASLLQLPGAERAQRSEGMFALAAADTTDVRDREYGLRTLPGWRHIESPEPPPSGRHVPRRERCQQFVAGLVFVLAATALATWAMASAINFLRGLG
jgi:hypothetical protein